MKTITLNRNELVWETRRNTWTAEDWTRLLSWMKERIESGEKYYTETYKSMYELIKDMTWDDAVEEFKKYQDGADDTKFVRVYREAYKYNDNNERVRDPENDWSYNEYFGEFLIEQMREDNYNSDVYDSVYADDYEEDFEFDEEEEKDNGAC